MAFITSFLHSGWLSYKTSPYFILPPYLYAHIPLFPLYLLLFSFISLFPFYTVSIPPFPLLIRFIDHIYTIYIFIYLFIYSPHRSRRCRDTAPLRDAELLAASCRSIRKNRSGTSGTVFGLPLAIGLMSSDAALGFGRRVRGDSRPAPFFSLFLVVHTCVY